MMRPLFAKSLRISDPAPFGLPGTADSPLFAEQEAACHDRRRSD
jgi:hypothetical protein